jgi:hypothetical protein
LGFLFFVFPDTAFSFLGASFFFSFGMILTPLSLSLYSSNQRRSRYSTSNARKTKQGRKQTQKSNAATKKTIKKDKHN